MAGLKSIQDLRNRVATFNNGLSSGAYIQQIIWDNDAYIVDMNAEEQLFEQGINRLARTAPGITPPRAIPAL